MTLNQAAFATISLVTLGSALGVVSVKNLLHSALLLILTFIGVAGLYVLLEAPFLAALEVLIYVGAISILILFAIMLTSGLMKTGRSVNEQWWLVLIACIILGAILAALVGRADWQATLTQIPSDPIVALGRAFLTTYVLPFEVASVLLLTALIGSIIIAREEK